MIDSMEKAAKNTYDHKTPFQTLLESACDFDLVNSVFVKIGERYNHWVDASKYTPEERVIMLVWHSAGIIDNGGFEFLFYGDFDGDPDYSITAESYKIVGLTRGYEAFQDAFRLFPDGKVPRVSPEQPAHDYKVAIEDRVRQYKTADESIREEINKKHWQDGWDKLREKSLSQYIRENVSKLGHLK
jgi:hypothetical protein